MSQHDDDPLAESFALLQTMLHERRPDALLLVFGQHGQRGEGQGGQPAVFGLDMNAAEQEVAHNLAVLLGDQRELRDKTAGFTDSVHQTGFGLAAGEGLLVDNIDGGRVSGSFGADEGHFELHQMEW